MKSAKKQPLLSCGLTESELLKWLSEYDDEFVRVRAVIDAARAMVRAGGCDLYNFADLAEAVNALHPRRFRAPAKPMSTEDRQILEAICH